ncbi:MAG: zinc-ribbon domain containing protein [Clostridia bacterium]|nr:zinc-ribbon domain containing protein [Clostridia bacterium]
MNLTVRQCADYLHTPAQTVLRILQQNNVPVSSETDALTFQQMALVERVLKTTNTGTAAPVPPVRKPDDPKPAEEPKPAPRSGDDPEAAARNALEHFVSSYKIFIDTCSLLSPYAESFFKNLTPLLAKHNARIIVPRRVIDELYKHQVNQTDPDLAQKARRALRNLQTMLNAGQVTVRGEESDNFADNVFQVVFTKFRIQERLLLITEDNRLAQDILLLNTNQSVKGKPVSVKRLSKYGYLAAFSWDNGSSGRNTPSAPRNDPPAPPAIRKFQICDGQPPKKDAPLHVSAIPGPDDTIYVDVNNARQPLRLGERIAGGGEGNIYRTNSPYVAKIYKKESITALKLEKIRKMLDAGLKCDGICFPVSPVYNARQEFVGYLMPLAKGRELQRSIFIKPVFLKHFPNWKRRDTVQLCVTILEKIKYLHDRNIRIGDINPANILVSSPTEVAFVDTDSYQIETLPCPVGTINFTAPEIQGKPYASFLRTAGNEYFAVATLLFMIQMPGKAPYAQQGGGDPIANIRGMNFSYPLGDQGSTQTPDGPWRFIWSHLTYDIKKAFYHTFRSGGEHSTESTRLNTDDWLKLFRYYLRLLDEGKLAKQDPMSEELFPTRHKLNPNVTYANCKLCGAPTNERSLREGICRTCAEDGEVVTCQLCKQEFIFTNYQRHVKKHVNVGICPECMDKSETIRCRSCGKTFTFSNYQKYVKKETPPVECRTCADPRNKVAMTLNCKDCGLPFTLTNGQVTYFNSKGMSIPKRCERCRGRSRTVTPSTTSYTPPKSTYPPTSVPKPAPKPTPAPPKSSYTYTPTPKPAPKPAPTPEKKDGTICFITTAVCEYMGKPDNCAELQTLRRFRDEWLAFQPGGQALIERYYEIAPGIVRRLKSSPLYAYYCEALWQEYLRPCLDMIDRGEPEACQAHYTAMVERFDALLR